MKWTIDNYDQNARARQKDNDTEKTNASFTLRLFLTACFYRRRGDRDRKLCRKARGAKYCSLTEFAFFTNFKTCHLTFLCVQLPVKSSTLTPGERCSSFFVTALFMTWSCLSCSHVVTFSFTVFVQLIKFVRAHFAILWINDLPVSIF